MTRRHRFLPGILTEEESAPSNGGNGGTPVQFPDPLYGGEFAPWAIPASEIADHPQSSALVQEVYDITPGRFNINVDAFCPAIYNLNDANTTATLDTTTTAFGGNLGDGAQIPWNESIFITPGDDNPSDTDSYTILVDDVTGECYEFFQSTYDNGTNVLTAGSGDRIANDIDGNVGVANVFTKQNGNRDSRACGIHHVIGMVLRSEVDAGVIPHCIPINYPNPTQFAFEAFATKGAGGTGGGAGRGFTGLRIVWDGLTQTDIDNWVATFPAGVQNFLRIMGECLRDFGGVVCDNAGNPVTQRGSTQLEHELSGNWSAIGVTQGGVLTALHSLLEPNQAKARALLIPTFLDSDIQNVACYPGIPYPASHPCFTGTPPPPPPSSTRGDSFNTGLRRIHVSKGGAAPIDGSTPDLSFSTIQAALNVMQAGDVITVGDGEYRERPSVSNRSGSVANPIWIAAENPHSVTIADYWNAARDGDQTWTLENGGTGRYSASHGDVYMGIHNGDFLPKYSSTANLDAVSVNGVTKPVQGVAFSGGRVHIRLKSGANPNGQNIFITETAGRNVIEFNNCDNVIIDGFKMEGGGEQSGVRFDVNCANPVVYNCRTDTSRFLCRVPSDTIVDYNTYTLAGLTGGKDWMRECITLNGGARAAFFDLIKGDLADGGNAVYEGGIAVGQGGFQTGAIHDNCLFKRNLMVGVFDGERFGEFQNSESTLNFYDEMGDDGIQFEDDRNDNNGNNNRAYFNQFRNPHGPVFSHQNLAAATHFVIRNIVEITEPSVFRPEFLIKTIRTAVGSTIRHAHNYLENFSSSGTRSPWYPFSTPTPSGGDEIDTFLNNIVVFEGGVSPTLPQAAGSPGDADGNALVNDTAETSLQGANGVFVGTLKSLLNINADFTLQSNSPARGIGQSLPGGFVDPITIPGANDDAGPWPFDFDISAIDIRDPLVTANTSELPERWTSPGA